MSKDDLNTSFEESLKSLEDIVSKLEKGSLTLDESLDEFQKGIEIYKYCNKILNDAEGKIKLILESEDGEIVSHEFDNI
ncbi:exodeoxyribonuclease 7 small subunit XseB [Gottschalkia acidurici 9a]|uniref:Exodeoxyribonuclease 7 small subunit n=1 Tax=Gottschalkia acidurici (strain ATCC 7906 / DSM 604 / BCRC 14475 / CIP 104303 / KCTC 5404 / NCIMB 10678 / 9a) TaxID=1128398 RepID=K0B0H8_GOTA9|nr:exodeoxyribonuclease VII small subunit [Gottschalkia acidurici]AFS78395.1 exodeoxyribonuclease 7 small subunit XseB [Gottschalkia acidurici 9a]